MRHIIAYAADDADVRRRSFTTRGQANVAASKLRAFAEHVRYGCMVI